MTTTTQPGKWRANEKPKSPITASFPPITTNRRLGILEALARYERGEYGSRQ